MSPGPYYKDSWYYISVPFSEIVCAAGSPKRLYTTWGHANYVAGDGSNVLTFMGIIAADAGTTLQITNCACSFRDLANNNYQYPGIVNNSLNKTFTGTVVEITPWDGFGTADAPYVIITTNQLNLLAARVNAGETFFNTNFVLDADITYPRFSSSSWSNPGTVNNYTPIGRYGHSFQGHFDGRGHTVKGIRVHKPGSGDADSSKGLFGFNSGTVRNVVLADTAITGYANCGGIVGFNSGTVSNCHAKTTVGIYCVATNAQCHGGIAGQGFGAQNAIYGCTSSATVKCWPGASDGESTSSGGIVGYLANGTVTNCIALGAVVTNASAAGAVVGSVSGSATLAANYYRGCAVNGVADNVGTSSGDVPGARGLYTLALADGISVVSAETVQITNVTYYAANTPVLIACTPPDGYALLTCTLNGTPFTGDTFTMPFADSSVSVSWYPTFNGSGTQDDPYLISTKGDLDNLAANVNNGITNYAGAKL